tara:strand:- start:162 stop:425 length:264 start_codon:yes stop_codon:yes gene_type:complete
MKDIDDLQRAQEIINDPVFEQIMKSIDEQYINELRNTDLNDRDQMQLMLQAIYVVSQIRVHLNQIAQGQKLGHDNFKQMKNGRRNKR